MKHLLSVIGLVLVTEVCLYGGNDAAIVDGPNYAFTVAAPKGCQLVSTQHLQAAFHRADTPFEKSAVIKYARSGDKKQLHVSNIPDLNQLDLKGIRGQHPAAKSKKIGIVKTGLGTEIPLYSFSGGGYSEVVAYDEHAKTITVFVLSAETDDQLRAARAAFDELLGSYVFLTETPNKSKQATK